MNLTCFEMMIVPMISRMDRTNWKVTSPFLKRTVRVPKRRLPFKTFTGLKEDRKKAG